MEVLIILVPIAIGLAALFVGGFVWAVKRGQYDDLVTPAHRILLDLDQSETKGKKK